MKREPIWINPENAKSLGILEGEETINQAGERILKEVLEVAGGKVTKAEALGFSDIAVDHVCRYI